MDETIALMRKAWTQDPFDHDGRDVPGRARAIRMLPQPSAPIPIWIGGSSEAAIKRTARYGSRRKIILTCSPTEKGNSRIEEAYAESDQRKPYVACHKCGHPQILTWGNVQFDSDLPLDEAAASAPARIAKVNRATRGTRCGENVVKGCIVKTARECTGRSV